MIATQSMPRMVAPSPNFPRIIDNLSASTTDFIKQDFDPARHIDFTPPESVILMKDIGYTEDTGISPVAVSQPFHLFSEEAIQQMRDEILDPKLLDECGFKSNIAASQLRGYSQKYAPFTHAAWTDPNTLDIVSKIAGVELVPEMDYEIGHINFSVKSESQKQAEIAEIESAKRAFEEDEGIHGCPWEDDKPVVGWHTDSYPFVCVLMLSDCTHMVGGETALRTGDGEILKVRGPGMGCAVVMQGRYILHQALRALGTSERITSVTSFRPKSPFIRDDTVLTSVRPISDLSELYYEFGEYRLEILEERIRSKIKELRDSRRAGKKINTRAMRKFLLEQEQFLDHTQHEMVEPEEVTKNYLAPVDVPDVSNTATQTFAKKRARVD